MTFRTSVMSLLLLASISSPALSEETKSIPGLECTLEKQNLKTRETSIIPDYSNRSVFTLEFNSDGAPRSSNGFAIIEEPEQTSLKIVKSYKKINPNIVFIDVSMRRSGDIAQFVTIIRPVTNPFIGINPGKYRVEVAPSSSSVEYLSDLSEGKTYLITPEQSYLRTKGLQIRFRCTSHI